MTAATKLLIKIGLFSFILLNSFNNYASFLDEQLKYSRVREAYQLKKPIIIEKLSSMELTTENVEVMIKAYKMERTVKLYVKKSSEKKWRLYDDYDFCSFSGDLGPKREEGDMQIPEGYYSINHFNPYSNFYLSLGVSYPNKADKLKSTARKKGGAIYMHGDCVTIGCIPITDDLIKEVFIMAVLGRDNGQPKIPLHIFPFEYSEPVMRQASIQYPDHAVFWNNLYSIETQFDSTMVLPKVGINSKGDYYVL